MTPVARPAGHAVHDEAPAVLEKEPQPHGRQTRSFCAFGGDENFPGAHSVQEDERADENAPLPHGVQAVAASATPVAKPAGHRAHCAEPAEAE